jgi:hypothetical protein
MMANYIANPPSPRYGIHLPADEEGTGRLLQSASNFCQMSPSNIPVSKKNNSKKTRMPTRYKPDKNAVICGRGKVCTSNPGNQKLRVLILEHLDSYGKASNKVEKTEIVSTIMDSIKKGCPDAPAFLKKEGDTWWEVDDAFAREKIGCIFRDALFTKYRSSTKAKLARRKQQIVTDDKMCTIPSSSEGVSKYAPSLMPPPSGGARSVDSIYQLHDDLKMMSMVNFNNAFSSGPSSGTSLPANGKNVEDYCCLLNNYLGVQQDSQPQQGLAQLYQPQHIQPSFAVMNHQEHSRHLQMRRDLYRMVPASMGLPSARTYANPNEMVDEAYSVVQSLQQTLGSHRPSKDNFKRFSQNGNVCHHDVVESDAAVVRKVRWGARGSSHRRHQKDEDDLVSLPDDISDIFD